MYRDLGNVIGKYIEENGLSVVRTYCGHGVGSLFHCAPRLLIIILI
jgi:methionyl aminopeptidase